jgi:hypothetical protein
VGAYRPRSHRLSRKRVSGIPVHEGRPLVKKQHGYSEDLLHAQHSHPAPVLVGDGGRCAGNQNRSKDGDETSMKTVCARIIGAQSVPLHPPTFSPYGGDDGAGKSGEEHEVLPCALGYPSLCIVFHLFRWLPTFGTPTTTSFPCTPLPSMAWLRPF